MWIESHQSLANHPKLKRLARKLDVSKQAAIGFLHLLWWWSLDYAPKGQVIPPFDAEDVADAVEYDGDPAELIAALVASGFLDCDNEILKIHDWQVYGGKLHQKRDAERARKRKNTEK